MPEHITGPTLGQLATAPAPSAGLGSNSNYILSSNCNPILDLSVTINVTEDIVCKSSSGSTPGFSFQLNAYSPPDQTSAWQQYVIALFGNPFYNPRRPVPSRLIGSVDNWPIEGKNIINDFFDLTFGPLYSAVLPAGYQLQIALRNEGSWRTSWDLAVTGGWAGPNNSGLLLYDRAAGVGAFYAVDARGDLQLLQQYDDWRTSWDLAVTGGWAGPNDSGLLLYDRAAGFAAFYAITSGGNMNLLQQSDGSVRAADYVVVDPSGSTVAHATKYLESLSSVSGAAVRGSDLAPIVAFELNLVGPVNAESTVLSSGAGNIVYTASTPLTALAEEPSCTESGYVTAETANSLYGPLPALPSTTFTQSFTVSSDGAMIRKEGKARPGFTVPPTARSRLG
jgi:hypothetical protein